jgi:Uma2 family endonuclease
MTVAIDKPAFPPRVKRWTKREYNDLVDRGVFRGQRLYLYRGELIEVAPMGTLHALGIMKVTDWLHDTFGSDYRIRCQMPFETPGESMPEPDAGLFTSEQITSHKPHPNAAVLLIEVSDSSVEIDQEKAFDYAAAGVPEYWIVNVRDRLLEIFRDPVRDPTALLGWRYSWHRVLKEDDQVSPLVKETAVVNVSTLVRVM